MSRWWPLVGVTAMVVLGWAVGESSTTVDDWFQRYRDSPTRDLQGFANPLALTVVGVAVVGFALFRRWWRFAAVAVALPLAAYLLVQVIKPLFGREKGGTLAYPSGHITTTTVVLGLFALVTGCAVWAVLIAGGYVALAVVGVGTTYHYFTDAVGGVLLGLAIVGVAALIARPHLTRVNPFAIWVTRDG